LREQSGFRLEKMGSPDPAGKKKRPDPGKNWLERRGTKLFKSGLQGKRVFKPRGRLGRPNVESN